MLPRVYAAGKRSFLPHGWPRLVVRPVLPPTLAACKRNAETFFENLTVIPEQWTLPSRAMTPFPLTIPQLSSRRCKIARSIRFSTFIFLPSSPFIAPSSRLRVYATTNLVNFYEIRRSCRNRITGERRTVPGCKAESRTWLFYSPNDRTSSKRDIRG